MFKKPFKIKSNTQLKSSERKSLRDTIIKNFPTLTEENVDELFPKKEVVLCCKLVTTSKKIVLVYLVQKRAYLFNVDDVLFPSVYLLWKFPNIGVPFTTNEYVMSRILQGSDLMMPGLLRNPANLNQFNKNEVAVVNTCDNEAVVAVGSTAMSSMDMLGATTGKSVLVHHTAGDLLCQMEDMPALRVPQMAAPAWLECNAANKEEFPALAELNIIDADCEAETCSPQERQVENPTDPEKSDVELMDELLKSCFLTAIKYSKTIQLPILTSSFYKNEMISCCPERRSLDISKSSFKKVGQFLKHMEKTGLIQIKEVKKGVETIEVINTEHEEFLNFYVSIDQRPRKSAGGNENDPDQNRSVSECLQVNKLVSPIFKEFGYNVGSTLTPAEVRKVITEFVRKHSLQDPQNKKFVKIEGDALKTLYKNEVAVTWEDLFNKVNSSMSVCFNFMQGGEEVRKKGKLPLITLSTQKRSGNKIVTIVENLEVYNIRLSEFAKECQHGVGASTSINKPADKKKEQILVQGNQILFIHKLLTGKYQIPKKYIRGLENAPQSKK